MQELDWDNVRYFLQVARAGSVSKAAVNMRVNQTTVSRRISALEESLETSLFERSGKTWLLTGIGEQLIALAEQMSDNADTLKRQVVAESQALSGKLRITIVDVCSQYLAMPAIQLFIEKYPEIDLEIIVTPIQLDLAAREADIALRTTNEPPANVIGKRIAQVAYAVYGTRDIAERVKNSSEVNKVPCITWQGDGETRPPWIKKNFPDIQRVHRTNELGVMLQMTVNGMGLAQMPCVFCDENPVLQRIPTEHVETGWGLWVLSHVDLRTTARVRLFRDFLVDHLEKNKDKIKGCVNN